MKNTDDGCVEVYAEGDAQAVQELINWCHKGPEDARVDTVEVSDAEEEGCESFVICDS